MAYGFNDDKSKAPFIKEILLSPNSGEKWKEYIPRVWDAINSIKKGNVLSIRFRNGGSNELTFMIPDKYYAKDSDGNLLTRTTITAVRNDFSNNLWGSINFWTFILFSSAITASAIPDYMARKIIVSQYDEIIYENYYAANATVESNYTFRIFYIP